MPGGHGRERPLNQQAVSELWGGVVALPVLGGVLVGATLLGTPRPGGLMPGWAATLLMAGFVGLLGYVLAGPRLAELSRRGAWVPPGRASRPTLVAAGVSAALVVAGAALLVGTALVSEWLGQL